MSPYSSTWSNTPDAFGVPGNMCGDVPEDFYAVVGRIVMVSAVLELKLLNLAQGLDRKNPQSAYAGKPAGRLITSTRKLLDTPGMENFRDDGNALLSRVAAALEDRNAVVHNAWPNPTLKDASGWRPVIPGQTHVERRRQFAP